MNTQALGIFDSINNDDKIRLLKNSLSHMSTSFILFKIRIGIVRIPTGGSLPKGKYLLSHHIKLREEIRLLVEVEEGSVFRI